MVPDVLPCDALRAQTIMSCSSALIDARKAYQASCQWSACLNSISGHALSMCSACAQQVAKTACRAMKCG